MPRTAKKTKSKTEESTKKTVKKAKTTTKKAASPAKKVVAKKKPTKKKVQSRTTKRSTPKTTKKVIHGKPKKTTTKKLKKPSHFEDKFTEEQQAELLDLIGDIIENYRREYKTLRTLTYIDWVLGRYNQRFPDTHRKFIATVEYGMEKNPEEVPKTVYTQTHLRTKEENGLFDILIAIGKGKSEYKEAKSSLEKIFATNNKHE